MDSSSAVRNLSIVESRHGLTRSRCNLASLLEYVEASGDLKAGHDLYDSALAQ